jgi:hypothetical protein
MDQLKWTDKQPNQPGYYWYYPEHAEGPSIVEVEYQLITHELVYAVYAWSHRQYRPVNLAPPNILWAGPLTPPTK